MLLVLTVRPTEQNGVGSELLVLLVLTVTPTEQKGIGPELVVLVVPTVTPDEKKDVGAELLTIKLFGAVCSDCYKYKTEGFRF